MIRHSGRTGKRKALWLSGAVVALFVVYVVVVVAVGGGQEHRQAAAGAAEASGAAGNNTTGGGSQQNITGEVGSGSSDMGQAMGQGSGSTSSTTSDAAETTGVDPSVGKPDGYGESTPEAAAADFVTAAYGYSGSSPESYGQGVGETVVWPDFYSSAGAAEVERYTEQVAHWGTRNAVVLTSFEVEETEVEEAAGDGRQAGTLTGYAYFTVEEDGSSSGDVEGSGQNYRQKLTLDRQGDAYLVSAAKNIEAPGGGGS